MPLSFLHDTLILDATCVINLYASGHIEEILGTIPRTVTVAAYVYSKEALWVYGNLHRQGQREPIMLQPLIDSGLIKVVTIETEAEAETLAVLSMKIRGQGEASTGAIAINRNWAIATDDGKARRLFQGMAGHLQLIYTLELLTHWVDVSNPPVAVINKALQSIRHRAAYAPQQNHPLYEWWRSFQEG